MKTLCLTAAAIVFANFLACAIHSQQEKRQLAQIEVALQPEVPRFLCINEKIATGAQPKPEAYTKLAQSGFRSVLSLRTANEGVDLKMDRELTEAAGMRYIHIPVVTAAPDPKRVDEFIRAVKQEKNHPMLIYCGSANRVAAFWMICRIVEEGWTEENAMEEAVKIGLTRPELKAFVQSYLAQHKQK
jgi:uncharacterized protein (TIGR01244 family)